MVRLERRDAAGAPTTASEWVYDYASRKPISREFTFSNGAWTQTDEKRRVFDGMDVVQERNAANEVTAQLVRSGNIGGILSRSTGAGASFYGYDGGGNVTLLTDSNGAEVGHYRYDAFGNTLESSGARAGENPYRFSTKELSSLGLYDYGYRFYLPSSGIWLNRDPLREDGGVNLYGMVGNNPINAVDPYGLKTPGLEYGPSGGGGGGVMMPPMAVNFDGIGYWVKAIASAVWSVIPVGVGGYVDQTYNQEAEHTTNQTPSNKPAHEKGQARKAKDKGGEKADANRDPPPKKKGDPANRPPKKPKPPMENKGPKKKP